MNDYDGQKAFTKTHNEHIVFKWPKSNIFPPAHHRHLTCTADAPCCRGDVVWYPGHLALNASSTWRLWSASPGGGPCTRLAPRCGEICHQMRISCRRHFRHRKVRHLSSWRRALPWVAGQHFHHLHLKSQLFVIFVLIQLYWLRSPCGSENGVRLAIGRSQVRSPQWERYFNLPQRHQVLVLVPENGLKSISNKP